MTKENNRNSAPMRVHINLKKRIGKFIQDFEKEFGINISETQATKILDDKIGKTGGLIVKK